MMSFSSIIIVLIMSAISLTSSRCSMLNLTASLKVFRVSIARTEYSQSAETYMYNESSELRCSRNISSIALTSTRSSTAVSVSFQSQCQHEVLFEEFKNISCALKYRVASEFKLVFL